MSVPLGASLQGKVASGQWRDDPRGEPSARHLRPPDPPGHALRGGEALGHEGDCGPGEDLGHQGVRRAGRRRGRAAHPPRSRGRAGPCPHAGGERRRRARRLPAHVRLASGGRRARGGRDVRGAARTRIRRPGRGEERGRGARGSQAVGAQVPAEGARGGACAAAGPLRLDAEEEWKGSPALRLLRPGGRATGHHRAPGLPRRHRRRGARPEGHPRGLGGGIPVLEEGARCRCAPGAARGSLLGGAGDCRGRRPPDEDSLARREPPCGYCDYQAICVPPDVDDEEVAP